MENIEKSVERVRSNFRAFCQQNGHLFDAEDIERVLTNDYTIKRYLYCKSFNEKSGQQMLIESMRWRKEFAINSLTDNYFPKEFYKSGAVFPYLSDRNGLRTLYLRIKMIKKIPEMKIYYKKFLAHIINKLDLEANGRGIGLIVDASGAGIANCDLELLLFLISTLNNHFPVAVHYVLLHAMPFALSGVWTIAKTLIPSKHLDIVRFVNTEDIAEYIDSQSLPDFMGGSAPLDYRQAPYGSPDIVQFGTKVVGLDSDNVHKVVEPLRQFSTVD